MKKRKKVLATLLTVTTCMAALAGCGKSPAQSETDTDGQVTADGTKRVRRLRTGRRSRLISGTITVRSPRKMKRL